MDASLYFNPMEGNGNNVDALTGSPLSIQQQEKEANRERRKSQQRQAELLLLHELQGVQAREMVRRLLADAFDMLRVIFSNPNMAAEETWTHMQQVRVRFQIIADTLGSHVNVLDEITRYAVMGELASILRTEIPANPVER